MKSNDRSGDRPMIEQSPRHSPTQVAGPTQFLGGQCSVSHDRVYQDQVNQIPAPRSHRTTGTTVGYC